MRTEHGSRSLGRETSPQRFTIQPQAAVGLAEAEWPFIAILKIPERMGDGVCSSGFAAALLLTVSGAQNAPHSGAGQHPQMAERASAIHPGYSVQGAEVRGSRHVLGRAESFLMVPTDRKLVKAPVR